MSAGKGDKPRPVDKKIYDKNFEKISWNKNNNLVLESKTKKGKTITVYKSF